jgi:AbrB family looped-hinge helix DNA binding protein
MTTTVSPKGNITIPKAVRERLNLKAGTEVRIEVQGETLVVKRAAAKLPHWRGW